MRLRMQTATGDYTFGRSLGNFWVDSSAGVAQLIKTRLGLWEGEWFLDNTDGTPYAQNILGTGTQSLYDLAIQQRVLGTQGVTSIVAYSSSVNPVDRTLTVDMLVMTQYSTTPVPVNVTI